MILSSSSEISVHCCNIENFNFFDPELQVINTKPVIKNKLKEFLSKLKKSLKFSQY